MATTTTVGLPRSTKRLLEKLIRLDFDAVEAYEAAVARLDDAEAKRMLGEFRVDHLRHTQNLGEHLRQAGHTPPSEPDAKRILTQGKVIIGGLVGDKAILRAMMSNEDDTNSAYERAGHENLPQEIQRTVLGNLEDERRHRAWIEKKLKAL